MMGVELQGRCGGCVGGSRVRVTVGEIIKEMHVSVTQMDTGGIFAFTNLLPESSVLACIVIGRGGEGRESFSFNCLSDGSE